MRLFEATGCGALLITDYRPNLGQLFEIGREIVAYSSIDECITLVKYYLEHPDEAAEIAARGQERTLRDHTYTKRMHQMSQWFKQLLNRKSAQKNIGGSSVPVSTGYEKIDISTVNSQDKVGWLSIDIPSRQRELVDNELEQLYKGEVIKPFAVLAELLKSRLSANCTVLEIGCSSGYYSEVLEYLLLRTIDYHGVDISSAMIALARSIYPDRHFYVGDGKELPFRDREFNCVISGCVLLHDTAYSDQIKETCRVTEQWLVAHRTPIHRQSPTSCYRKQAYGIDTVELHFNERELLDLFRQGGFILLDSIEYSSDPVQDRYDVSYLFRRFC
jgi:SAM-dependent methyltransferase